MREDLSRYSEDYKNSVVNLIKMKSLKEIVYAISSLADVNKVPCIVLCYWFGEATGWPDEIKDKHDFLKTWYGYTEILNKPEGCPW